MLRGSPSPFVQKLFAHHPKKDGSEHPPTSSAPPSPVASAAAESPQNAPTSPLVSTVQNIVLLHDWWLVKMGNDSDDKKLAVEGFVDRGLQHLRTFKSAPIIKRFGAFTLETADGITVKLQGFINKNRTDSNGFPPEACTYFLVGFPYNWEVYAAMFLKKHSFNQQDSQHDREASIGEENSQNAFYGFTPLDEKCSSASVADDIMRIPDLKLKDKEKLLTTSKGGDNLNFSHKSPVPCIATPETVVEVERSDKLAVNESRSSSGIENDQKVHSSGNITAIFGLTTPIGRSSQDPLNKKKKKHPFASYIRQGQITCEGANKAFASPELRNYKRSRSGRVLVPTLDSGCQQILYDSDGACIGVLSSSNDARYPCIGSKYEPQLEVRNNEVFQRNTNELACPFWA